MKNSFESRRNAMIKKFNQEHAEFVQGCVVDCPYEDIMSVERYTPEGIPDFTVYARTRLINPSTHVTVIVVGSTGQIAEQESEELWTRLFLHSTSRQPDSTLGALKMCWDSLIAPLSMTVQSVFGWMTPVFRFLKSYFKKEHS